MITQAFYISQSMFEVGNVADRDILREAQRNNPSAALTGFLFRTRDNYFQILEGPKCGVRKMMKEIRSDARHYGLTEWPHSDASERAFPSWNMGYAITGQDDFLAVAFRHSKQRSLEEIIRNLVQLAELRFEKET